MKKVMYKENKGFTLIETMIAVFLLTIAFVGLINLNAQSLFSARYARNQITANYLAQEAIDYIRNDRDSTAFLDNSALGGNGWTTFLNHYGYNNGSPVNCFATFSSDEGCYFEPADVSINPIACINTPDFGVNKCPTLLYDPMASNNDFYTYHNTSGTLTGSGFKRQILMWLNPANPDELDVKVTVEWQNGTLVRSRSLQVSLLDWQK
jgi:prepilin-type N-terminal cleavage/methylation domain-containing protein